MEDRALLELAARAAGIPTDSPHWPDVKWSPLKDDGDALRLAAKLRIDVRFFTARTEACYLLADAQGFVPVGAAGRVAVSEIARKDGGDRAQSARRAIVRVAAEIGRTLHKEPTQA